MQKIRVSTLVPKQTVEKPKQKENSVIDEEVNEDVEKEEEAGEEDDYMEKKKEKEKLKQKKAKGLREKDDANTKGKSNRLMKTDDHELYAEYKYSSKTFPEGREQFSFRYNLVDVVLFGGLIMNKNNNNVWMYDNGNN